VFILDVYVRGFRNDKFTELITKINSIVSGKLKESSENKLVWASSARKKSNNSYRSELSNNESLEKLPKKDKKPKKEKTSESGNMDRLNRLLKAKEKRK